MLIKTTFKFPNQILLIIWTINWHRSIIKSQKRKALGIQLNKYLWLINHNSPLALENKLIIYKSIFKPMWSHGVELWRTAAKSHLDIIQRLQFKILRLLSSSLLCNECTTSSWSQCTSGWRWDKTCCYKILQVEYCNILMVSQLNEIIYTF